MPFHLIIHSQGSILLQTAAIFDFLRGYLAIISDYSISVEIFSVVEQISKISSLHVMLNAYETE